MNTPTPLHLWFDHGLGDCVHFAHVLKVYQQHGYDVRVHYEENKCPVWEAAGIPHADLDGANYVPWEYHNGFNSPRIADEMHGNKIASNLRDPLPDLGVPIEDAWRDICAVDLTETTRVLPGFAAARDEADQFLRGLPEPIILLHLCGTNMPESKNMSAEDQQTLYHCLLDASCASLILLDWDHRVPKIQSGRVRHMKTDWGHIDVLQLAALMDRASMLIGVDSGPFHFAGMTRCPALGVFHHHYPACVALPRSRSAMLTRGSAPYQDINRARRSQFSIVEYSGVYPAPEDVALHALRMLDGPRYMDDQCHAGRDVMIQQWVRDWLRGGTGLAARADRDQTMDIVLRRVQHFADPRIVETGCVRSVDDWSAGYATYIFGAVLDGLGRGELITVDNDPRHLETAGTLCEPWAARIKFVESDSVAWLRKHEQSIDLLYLDSLDCEHPEHAEHGLREIQAAERRLHDDSVVVWDDTVWDGGWRGKGTLGVPWLLDRGWSITAAGYQTVMERP